MLRSLLSAHGCNPEMITVFIDGYFEVSVFTYCKRYLQLNNFVYLVCVYYKHIPNIQPIYIDLIVIELGNEPLELKNDSVISSLTLRTGISKQLSVSFYAFFVHAYSICSFDIVTQTLWRTICMQLAFVCF